MNKNYNEKALNLKNEMLYFNISWLYCGYILSAFVNMIFFLYTLGHGSVPPHYLNSE